MLHVDKVDSYLTEIVEIGASKLKAFTNYKFELRLHSDVGILRSYCILQSDEKGKINLATAKPIRGTYTDADPMGLFMTVERTNDVPYGSMARYTDGTHLFLETCLHSKALEISWANHIKFFKKHLGTPKSVPDFERDAEVLIPQKSKL